MKYPMFTSSVSVPIEELSAVAAASPTRISGSNDVPIGRQAGCIIFFLNKSTTQGSMNSNVL